MTAAEAARRAIDIVVGLAALVVLLPIMAIIAVAILLEDGRPVLFWQTRLGQGGNPFQMCKFRKFAPNTGTAGLPLTMRGDERMTRIGRFLATTKLDEVPQFFNVLRGDMAIIGPRPESMAFADCFAGRFRAVLSHKPGIFGPAQTLFRDEASFYHIGAEPTEYYRRVLFPLKAELDLAYYPERSITKDLRWLLRSLLAIVSFENERA